MNDPIGSFFTWLATDQTKAALAGAAGGVVRWVTLREKWQDGLASLVVGALCALYLGPIVEPLLEPAIGKIAPSGNSDQFAGFVVGLGGISLTGLLIDIIRLWRGQAGGRAGGRTHDDP